MNQNQVMLSATVVAKQKLSQQTGNCKRQYRARGQSRIEFVICADAKAVSSSFQAKQNEQVRKPLQVHISKHALYEKNEETRVVK